MDYLALLTHSYAVTQGQDSTFARSRLEYLSNYIFGFTTYDSAMAELFASKAVEVCAAINDLKTFDYIKDAENYRWYLLMVNMPFFAERLEWGTSIRGAWWDTAGMAFESHGLWVGETQYTEPLKFSAEEWHQFIAAVMTFAAGDQGDTSASQVP